jgi:hypothetical protein
MAAGPVYNGKIGNGSTFIATQHLEPPLLRMLESRNFAPSAML